MFWLVFFNPQRLWALMFLWKLDGDPGLLQLRGPVEAHVHEWRSQVRQLTACGMVLALAILILDYGWQWLLLLLVLPGFVFVWMIVYFAGAAFGVALCFSVSAALLAGTWTSSDMLWVEPMPAVLTFGLGHSARVGWITSEMVSHSAEALFAGSRTRGSYVALLWVVTLAIIACYAFGSTPGERATLIVIHGIGIFAIPLGLWTRRRFSKPLGFLSYRRNDRAASSAVQQVRGRFPDSTFVDEAADSGPQHTIGAGQRWRSKLLSELGQATLLAAFVGPDWEQDEPGARQARTTQANPRLWVYLEMGYARRRGIPVLPILVNREDLPVDLAPLDEIHHQKLQIDCPESWERFVGLLSNHYRLRGSPRNVS